MQKTIDTCTVSGVSLRAVIQAACTLMIVLSVTMPVSLSASASAVFADDARIVSVTVYRDRAEVVKEAVVQVPAGASSVEFSDIPYRVEADTLRVSAEGVPATLGAVEIQDRVETPRETPEWRKARDEVKRLERAIAELHEGDLVDRELKSFLKSLGNVTATSQARDMGEGHADPAAITAIYGLMESKLRLLGAASLERKDRRSKLDEELKLARAHLATLRPASNIRSRVAAVEVEATSAGRLTVRLAYLAPGASWRPSYRATLDADSGKVSIVSEGVVRQSTGEDWSGVELHLSSGSPARGVEPPKLTTWVLRPRSPLQGAYARRAKEDAALEEMVVEGHGYQNVIATAPGVADAEPASAPARVAESQVVHSAYNVTFRVPGDSFVPADGSDHRVVLRHESLDANVVHRTVPGIDDRAFLTAVTTSPEEYPMMAGPVRVFAGGAYLGSYFLEETGPGIELTLPFGVDNRIDVIRVPEPKMKSREGLVGKQRQVHKTERTIVHNLIGHKATLVIEDRLPVSEEERIVVQMGDRTTPGYKESEHRPGVLLWTIELDPGEKKEIILDYTVRYPKEIVIPGL